MVNIARWKIVVTVVICVLSVFFALPSGLPKHIYDALPSWLPHDRVSLGLDLQGGSYVLFEVKVEEAIRERLTSLVDSVRQTLRNARPAIGYSNIGRTQNGVTVSIRGGDAEVSRARQLIRGIDQRLQIDTDGQRITVRYTEEMLRELRRAAVEQSLKIIEVRVNETGLREPDIQSQGADRILVQLPGIGNPQRVIDIIGKTAKMTFHLLDETVTQQDIASGRAPPGTNLLPADNERNPDGTPVIYPVRTRVMVSGENLVDAQPTIQDGQPVVSFRFDAVGARRFGEVTRRNVGKPFAIVLDGKVISAPVIREPILGGNGIISGNFTTESARELALLLRSGALPVPLSVVEQRTVGPGLGADSIRAGITACAIGLIGVFVSIWMMYGLFGTFANIALLMNLAGLIALLAILQATLTLPGIAGIVLTIGMAVDANVLIYERIREEQRAGRPPISAFDAGFTRAFSTIMDSNLTTLVAGILLYIFGSGPVRGFAVTLSIGIATSMFSAIMVTRILGVYWLRRARPKVLPI